MIEISIHDNLIEIYFKFEFMLSYKKKTNEIYFKFESLLSDEEKLIYN